MITPSFSLTATERVLPRLALDFTTANLDSRITFTRTTGASNPATYVANTGYITLATNNQPRFDFNPVTLVCRGLLIEESRTNACRYSQDIGGANWTLTNASIGTSVISPDGTTNMQKLVEDSSASTTHSASSPSISVTSGTTYTYSFFAKAGERTKVRMAEANGLVNGVFDLSNGTVTQGTAGVVSIQDYGNNVYRCIGVFTSSVTSGGSKIISQLYTTSQTYTGDGTSGAYVWGFQAETGAFATSYIPTEASALTRNADVATMTGTNFSDWFNASEGSFFAWANVSANAQTAIAITDGTTNNAIVLKNSISNGAYVFQMISGGAVQVQMNTAGNANSKLAYAYKLNNCAGSVDAGAPTTDNTATIPTVDRIFFGSGYGSVGLNGIIKRVSYWPQRLTNAELQAFSK